MCSLGSYIAKNVLSYAPQPAQLAYRNYGCCKELGMYLARLVDVDAYRPRVLVRMHVS